MTKKLVKVEIRKTEKNISILKNAFRGAHKKAPETIQLGLLYPGNAFKDIKGNLSSNVMFYGKKGLIANNSYVIIYWNDKSLNFIPIKRWYEIIRIPGFWMDPSEIIFKDL